MRSIIRATTVVALAGLAGGTATAWASTATAQATKRGIGPRRRARPSSSRVVGAGRGVGMAFAADQNGYPGPMHVLELKDRAEQEGKMQPRGATYGWSICSRTSRLAIS